MVAGQAGSRRRALVAGGAALSFVVSACVTIPGVVPVPGFGPFSSSGADAWVETGAENQTEAQREAGTEPVLDAALVAPSYSDANTPLWRVSRGGKELWLFGAIHYLEPDTQWRRAAFEQALANAQVVVLETDPGEAKEAFGALPEDKRLNPAGVTLSQLIGPKAWGQLANLVSEFGESPADYEPLRPWLAGQLVTAAFFNAVGADETRGVDRVVLAEARATGKYIVFLETPDRSLQALAGLEQEAEAAFLRRTVDGLTHDPEALKRLVSMWVEGDVPEIADAIAAGYEGAEDAQAAHLTDRNERWASVLSSMMAGERRVLAVVGLAHLVGEDGVPALLKAEGYKVERH